MWKAKALATVLGAALVSAAGVSVAESSYERAKVVDVRPVYETVTYNVPTEQCYQEQVEYREPVRGRGSATGPIIGAIIGGAIGNAVGHHKSNQRVGTAVGAILGGSIGADVSRRRAAGQGERVRYGEEQVCRVVHEERSEEQLSGYDVRYRYGGSTYTTRMSRDPGEYIRVRVSVTPVG